MGIFNEMGNKGISIICNVESKETFEVEPVSRTCFHVLGSDDSDEKIVDFAIVIKGDVVLTTSLFEKIFDRVVELLDDELI